ncbi:MAG: Ldh family oxidoreductase [Bacillota bacterium]
MVVSTSEPGNAGVRVRWEELEAAVTAALVARRVPAASARLVAESLVLADLRGVTSHGVRRLPVLLRKLDLGVIDPQAGPVVKELAPAAVAVDARDGLGQVAAVCAMEACVSRARHLGLACAVVYRSSHFGIAAYPALVAARQDMVGVALSNAEAAVAPWGGRRPVLGTNPLAVAIPCPGRDPVVLDMATSVAGRSRIRQAAQRGEAIPPGWALDEEGRPATDPVRALRGVLLPFGGAKGYGLSLVVEVLCGVLSGARLSHRVRGLEDTTGPGGAGHFLMALDVATFAPAEEFRQRMEELVGLIKACPALPGVDEVYLPGEIESQAERKHRTEGISVPAELWQQILAGRCL